jgi:hypothetical protein
VRRFDIVSLKTIYAGSIERPNLLILIDPFCDDAVIGHILDYVQTRIPVRPGEVKNRMRFLLVRLLRKTANLKARQNIFHKRLRDGGPSFISRGYIIGRYE